MSVALPLANITSTSAFLYCPPVTQAQFTTVYETVLPAACETSWWMATYTVTETCVGDKTDYATPTIPPGFVVTTVSCQVCDESEVIITCPAAHPTGMGKPTVHVTGNGVTATIVPTPAPAPANGGVPAAPAAPTGFVVNWSGSGGGSGHDHDHDHGHGSGAGSGSGGVSNNGTIGNPPITLTGAAASVRRSLMVGAGLAFLAGPFFLL